MSPRYALVAVALTATALVPAGAHAQRPIVVRLDRGMAVRLHIASVPVVGTIEGWADDSALIFRTVDGMVTHVERDDVERFEYSYGPRVHPLEGAAVGMLAGGLIFGVQFGPAIGLVYGPIYGFISGLVLGALVRTHDWQAVPLHLIDHAVGAAGESSPRLHLTSEAPGVVSLGLSLPIGR